MSATGRHGAAVMAISGVLAARVLASQTGHVDAGRAAAESSARALECDSAAPAPPKAPIVRKVTCPLPPRLLETVPVEHRSHPFFLLSSEVPIAPLRRGDTDTWCHEVLPRVYLGSVWAADRAELASLGITHVVNTLGRSAEEARSAGVRYFTCSLVDVPGFRIGPYLLPAATWIRDALAASPSHRVLVHCLMGVSRSASLVIAHAMVAHGLRVADAFARVQSVRTQVTPNPGFRAHLVALDAHLFDGARWPHAEEGLPDTASVDAVAVSAATAASAAMAGISEAVAGAATVVAATGAAGSAEI